MVDAFCRLVLDARTSLQATGRVLEIFFPQQAEQGEIPHATTGRWWLLRLGHYKLHCPKEQADDWVWLVDHTVQIGVDKCLAIAGVRLAHLPPRGECLELKHLEPLALLPVEQSNGEVVYRQLTERAEKDGVPRAILSDEGSDLLNGVKRFCEDHPGTARLSDIAHKAARLLKRRLERDQRWSSFCSEAAQSKSQTQQTELAFLGPQQQRSKARYMNLGPLLEWAERTLRILDRPPPEVLEHCTAARLEEKFGWLREYRPELAGWSRAARLVEATVDLVRCEGYSAQTAAGLPERLTGMVQDEADEALRNGLVDFVRTQSQTAAWRERLPGSTEILESSFGKLKSLEGEHQRGGFTGMLLTWAALFGETSRELLVEALSSTPTKHVQRWLSEHLGSTLASKRRAAYRAIRTAAASAPEKPEET